MTSQQLVETIKTFTDLEIEQLVIEDDTPVDNFQSEQQQRLLVEPLCSSQVIPPPFIAAANVGVFYHPNTSPIVPDMLLSLGVYRRDDYSQKRNRCYLVQELGKLPEVCIEIVSNREGDEITLSRKSRRKGKKSAKKDIYAEIGIQYYIVFDPLEQIQGIKNMHGALLRIWHLVGKSYEELTPPQGIREIGQPIWLENVGLGLTLWLGRFGQDGERLWLRWCDYQGQVIPTGAEGKEMERRRAEIADQRAKFADRRAEIANQRAEQLAERLRSLGFNPDEM
jgi:Uma2 family endonuclease